MKYLSRFNFSMVVSLLVLGALTACVPVQTNLQIPLSELAIQPQTLTDTPELFQIGAIRADDPEQPLNRAASDLAERADGPLLDYREAYRVQGFNQKRGVYVGNYIYRYADSAQAAAAAQAFFDATAEYQGKLLSEGPDGRTILLVGSAEDGLYWYCGVRDNVLVLLMVNGPLSSETQASFEELVGALPVGAAPQE